jgi:hypothetical protein
MLLEYWLLALRSKVGVAIPTDNRAMLRQQLYKARYEAKDPRLDDIVMIIPEKEDEIWLVHRDADSRSPFDQSNVEPLHR